MARGGKPPSQSWKTFLRNHAEAIAAIDVKRLKELEIENSRLRRAVSDLTLDKLILTDPILAGLHHHYVRI